MRSKKVSYEQKITCAELTLAWCILKFGRNNRKKKNLNYLSEKTYEPLNEVFFMVIILGTHAT